MYFFAGLLKNGAKSNLNKSEIASFLESNSKKNLSQDVSEFVDQGNFLLYPLLFARTLTIKIHVLFRKLLIKYDKYISAFEFSKSQKS